MADPPHRLVDARYSAATEGHVAVCSCGWRSATVPTAGMAGARWDRHVAEMTDAPEGPDEAPG